MTSVPVVDILGYGLDESNEGEVTTDALQTIGDDMCRALRDIGFCYIRNHGIPQSLIDQVNTVSRTFFEKSVEYKTKYQRKPTTGIHGWMPRGSEGLNPERPPDNKEAFNITPLDEAEHLPDVSGFDVAVKDLREACHVLSLRILDLMSVGLHLEDRHFFRKCHKSIAERNSTTTLRVLYYPALSSDAEMKANQIRCGEHSDFGSLTLLFQDDVGGLEVRTTEGEYISASPIPGTILINIGDMMQRWTSDKLLATKHRVLIPEDEIKKRKSRQSIAFFVVPDNDVMIQSLDKTAKYEPISSLQFLQQRLASSY